VPLEAAGAPAPLVQLILRLMAPAAAERPSDAREVRRELERIHPAARRTLAQRLQTERVVGRERELARLERWMALAPRGPRVLLVTGEPGIGKSALLGELAVRAALAGHAVVHLSCAAFEAPGALGLAVTSAGGRSPPARTSSGSPRARSSRSARSCSSTRHGTILNRSQGHDGHPRTAGGRRI
jgi:hypothetical protein